MLRWVRRFALGCSLALAAAWPRAARAADGEDAIIALARNLLLVVTEAGPEQPWTLHLHNIGPTPIAVMADPGLLWFEVVVPGASAPRTCRLPEPLWPTAMRRRSELVLAPGERFSRRFDPRFFCFADMVQTTLVPGARVTPHFGWPHEGRDIKANGKAQGGPARPRAPFVAWVAPAAPAAEPAAPPPAGGAPLGAAGAEEAEGSEGAEGSEPSTPPTPWQPPSEGLKNLTGSTVVLAPTYDAWSERKPAATAGINVAMLAGSDAVDERNALVTLAVGNGAAVAQTVVVRRELISFEVTGPDGSFECPTGDLGAPDVASFSTLGPRASERLVVRLLEMCPRGGFARPGVYEVRATFHAKFSGQAQGLDAFVGDVQSPRPALVRVRSGERPSFPRVPLMVAAGAPAAAGDSPALDGQTPPSEEQPAEGAPAEEAPAPEAPPPEGTSVE
ncbi:MAG TPA: hypothetical protein VNN80_21275 [Polyangiaceae bacterium]|nr:hypothetical protein [Polyangiaceae bacterium]